MQARQLLILAVLAVAAIAAALFLNADRSPSESNGGRLLPELEKQLNSISELRVIGADGNAAVTLNRTENNWVVVEKDGYPADRAKLRNTLLELAKATVIEQKTSKPDFYARLGVENPGSPDAANKALEIVTGSDTVRVIVGKIAFDGYGTYVRLDGDPQGLLVSAELEPSTVPLDWISGELVDIAAADVAAVSIKQADGEQLRIEKSDRSDTNFTVRDVPEGRALSSEFAADSIAAALGGLGFDDVRARIVTASGSVTTARYEMFDGRVIEIELTEDEDRTWAAFDFGFDPALAARFSTAATSADESTANSEESVAAPENDPEQEIVDLNARLGGWSFAVPDYKITQFSKRMDDLLAPLESEAGTE